MGFLLRIRKHRSLLRPSKPEKSRRTTETLDSVQYAATLIGRAHVEPLPPRDRLSWPADENALSVSSLRCDGQRQSAFGYRRYDRHGPLDNNPEGCAQRSVVASGLPTTPKESGLTRRLLVSVRNGAVRLKPRRSRSLGCLKTAHQILWAACRPGCQAQNPA